MIRLLLSRRFSKVAAVTRRTGPSSPGCTVFADFGLIEIRPAEVWPAKKVETKKRVSQALFFLFWPAQPCVIAVAKIDSKGRIEVLVARSGTDAGRNGNGMRRIERSSAIIPYSMMAEANAG